MPPRVLVMPLAIVLSASAAQAHLCNNIYRTPDRIIVKPEKDTATLETNDSLRIFVRNNYPTTLRNVRLLGQMDAPGLQVTITPDRIPAMKAGRKEAFTVRITAGVGAPPGGHALKLSIAADSIGWGNAGSQPVQPVTDDDLLRALGDSNPSCSVLAAESLARRGNAAGVNWLRDQIAHGERRAIRAAGRSGNPDLVPFLLPKLADRNGFVSGTTCLALGLLKAGLDQVAGLRGSGDAYVATAARAGLILAGRSDEADLSYLRRRLTDNDPWVRCAAAWGCAWMDETQALAVLDEVFGQRDAELVVFAGDALVTLAERQEGLTAEQAPAAEVTPQPTASSAPAFAAPTPDRLSLKQSQPTSNCATGGQVSVQLYHSYPGPLHNVRVEASGEGITLTAPATLAFLKPTQIATLSLGVRASAPRGADTIPAQVTVTADELREPGRFTITVPCTEAGVQQVALQQAAPVGEVGVRVVRFGDYHLLLFGLPLLLVVAALIWRWRKQRRA